MNGLATVGLSDDPSISASGGISETTMRNFGRTTLAELFDDWIIYRNLEPLESTLPGLKSAYRQMELPKNVIPRKVEEDYAKATTWFIQEAQQIRGATTAIKEIAWIGDSLYNDGQAFQHAQQVSQWIGACFIGSEEGTAKPTVHIDPDSGIYQANRWAALGDWAGWAAEQGISFNDETAVIIDMDKTALGALGRNDHTINQVRLEAIYRTMSQVLGKKSDQRLFEEHYTELNQPKYHGLTSDNQDYLAYICLVTNAGLVKLDEIVDDVDRGSLDEFSQFIRWVDSRMMLRPNMGLSLQETHHSVIGSVRAGDPTPFKRFRRQEFITTIEQMNVLPDDSSVHALLADEITITQEVRELALWLKERGVLVLCLSDKPDEASTPARNMDGDLQPIHRTETHSVGHSIQDTLAQIGRP